MIKISFISPTAHIKEFQGKGDFILALAHLIDQDVENEYEKAIKELNLPIFLDNSLFELGVAENFNSVLLKAKKIGAELIFCPDVLYNSEETLINLAKYGPKIKAAGFKVGYVPQAHTKKDYLKQIRLIQEDDRVDLVGLSILAVPKSYKRGIALSRFNLLTDMVEMNLTKKDCHLLGLGSDLRDVVFANLCCSFVTSHDSSSAVQNAFQGKQIKDNGKIQGGKTKVHVDFNYKETDPKKLELAQFNINQYRKLLK